MRRTRFLCYVIISIAIPCIAGTPPVVTDVTATQHTDGSGIVDIAYTLADADGDDCTVSVKVSNDGGNTWIMTASDGALSGDVGPSISPGAHTIQWDSKTDLPGAYGTQYQIMVIADDGSTPQIPPSGMVFVTIDDVGFNGQMSRYETTNAQYCYYLNAAMAENLITVNNGTVYASDDTSYARPYFDTEIASFHTYFACYVSQITYDNGVFTVRSRDWL